MNDMAAKGPGSSKRKYSRSIDEVTQALVAQRQFLRTSCQLYDDGHHYEAARIASAVYVIAFDGTGRTHSLLSQLGIKQSLKFVSTSTALRDDTFPQLTLCGVFVLPSGKAEIFPWCANPDKAPKAEHVSFATWWDTPIFRESWLNSRLSRRELGKTLSRRNLVFHLRSQDGGAHYDGELRKEEYISLAISGNIGMYKQDASGGSVPFANPHLASMRQIGWEVERSLMHIPGGPALPPPATFPPAQYRIADQCLWEPETLSVIPPKKMTGGWSAG